MSAYAPPSLSPDDLDVSTLVAPTVVKLGGALLVTAGFFVTGTALQVAALFPGVFHLILRLCPCGSSAWRRCWSGPRWLNGRGWAAIVGTGVAGGAAIATLGWSLYAIGSFVFGADAGVGVGSSVLAALVAPPRSSPAKRLSGTPRAVPLERSHLVADVRPPDAQPFSPSSFDPRLHRQAGRPVRDTRPP